MQLFEPLGQEHYPYCSGSAMMLNEKIVSSNFYLLEAKLIEQLKTNLTGADLSEADLSRAKLLGARITLAKLIEANLRQADIRGIELKESQIRESYK